MADVRGNDDILVLGDEQLRTLALLIRNQELPIMSGLETEQDRVTFLEEVSGACDNTIAILDTAVKLRKKNEGVAKAADVAADIQDYAIYAINWSLQSVRNTGMRKTCIDKLKEHIDDLATDLDHGNNLEILLEEVPLYKKTMFEYAKGFQSATARSRSRDYSMWLVREGIEFPSLVNRHKNKLGYENEFKLLEEDQKLEVYNSIVKESGRAEIPTMEVRARRDPSKSVKAITLLGITAGLMAWDVYTAEYKLESVLSNALSVLVDVGSFAVGVAVKSAVSTVLVKAGTVVVSVAGFVVGVGVGILFAAASGALLNLILGTGGNEAPSLDGVRFRQVTLPDGLALAYELSHQQP